MAHERSTLFVDLDGSLIRSDLLMEALVQTLKERPALLLRLPVWLMSLNDWAIISQ